MSSAASDRELVRRCLGGSEPAFRELYYRHVDRVFRLATRILGPGTDAGDTVQEVFVEVGRSLPAYRGEAAFTTWLHRITINVSVEALRGRVRERRHAGELTVDPAGAAPDGRLEAREMLGRLYAALDRLSARQRVVFVLFELEGMSLEETAAATGVPLFTAAARLRRARLALAELLDAPELLMHRREKKV